jgi:hypothetical protein
VSTKTRRPGISAFHIAQELLLGFEVPLALAMRRMENWGASRPATAPIHQPAHSRLSKPMKEKAGLVAG